MKIAVVTGTYPSVSETFVTNHVKFLKSKNIKVDFYCLKKKSTPKHILKTDVWYPCVELRWRHFMPVNKLQKILKLFVICFFALQKKQVSKALGKLFFTKGKFINTEALYKYYFKHFFTLHNYDIMHVHFGTNAIKLVEQIKCFDKKVVVTFHGFDVHKYSDDFYKEIIQLNHVFFTVNSNYTREKVINLGVDKDRITLWPMSVDTEFFSYKKRDHNTFRLLFVGRLISLKSPMNAILITEKILNSGYTVYLSIVGDGEDYKTCLQYIQKQNLEKNIILLGNKDQKEVKSLMQSSDVLLLPGIVDKSNRAEAQGLVVQEAQAMGLPVLVSDVGGIKEGLLPNETGYLLKEGDLDGFVEKLKLLIGDCRLRSKIGRQARAFVIKNYDKEVVGERLLKIYKS